MRNLNSMGDPPDEDTLLDLLSNGRRRYALRCLNEHVTMTLADVAEEIAVWERETTIDNISAEEVKEIYTALYHVHVPKMESVNVVTYDQQNDLVGLTELGHDLKSRWSDVQETVDWDDLGESTPADTEPASRAQKAESISVDLSPETITAIHAAIRQDERFPEEIAYDEVIRTVLSELYDVQQQDE